MVTFQTQPLFRIVTFHMLQVISLPAPKKVETKWIHQLKNDGLKVTQIANKLGISRQTVWRALKLPQESLDYRIKLLIYDLEQQIPITQRSHRTKEARLMQDACIILREVIPHPTTSQ